jgi:hypothetical protein
MILHLSRFCQVVKLLLCSMLGFLLVVFWRLHFRVSFAFRCMEIMGVKIVSHFDAISGSGVAFRASFGGQEQGSIGEATSSRWA